MTACQGHPKRSFAQASAAFGLLTGFLVLYSLNGSFQVGDDAVPNVHLPLSVLNQGDLSFSPDESPFMFTWSLRTAQGPVFVKFARWEAQPSDRETVCFGHETWVRSERRTWRELRNRGELRVHAPNYYLVPALDTAQRGYVNQYGPGAGLSALPFFAIQSLVVDDLAQHQVALWYGAKFVAAFCVAASVAVVYLTLRHLVAPWESLVIALAYGAGTCVWSVASQTLWQSGPDVMFLALCAYCLVRLEESDGWACGSSLAAACAVICRPTSALLVITIAAYLLTVSMQRWRRKKSPVSLATASRPLLLFVLAGLPLAIWLGSYNWYYLGAPWKFGQLEAGRRIASMQLGNSDLWQSSWWEGLLGLLVSPSRGMLVYSPILGFAIWGAWRVWRAPGFEVLRPLSLAAVLLWVLQAKWFDWHGGHSFGYRLMVDAMPLLALCSAAIADTVRRQRPLIGVFAFTLLWSVGVQVIGAYAYDVIGWNAREVYAVKPPNGRVQVFYARDQATQLAVRANVPVQAVRLDVDWKCNRWRLWSITDSQLVYYLAHFRESCQGKKQLTADWLPVYVLKPSCPR